MEERGIKTNMRGNRARSAIRLAGGAFLGLAYVIVLPLVGVLALIILPVLGLVKTLRPTHTARHFGQPT